MSQTALTERAVFCRTTVADFPKVCYHSVNRNTFMPRYIIGRMLMKPSFPASSVQRILITGLLILLQLVWFVLFFTKLAEVASWINLLFLAISVLIVLHLVIQEENPAYKIGWIILIELFPLLGGALYLCFGNQRPSARMRAKFRQRGR